jgi:hypothetical protein
MAHWLIFAGLGPLLGWTSGVVAIALFSAAGGETPFPGLSVTEFFLFGVPIAYLFGLIPALVSGSTVQQLQIRLVTHHWLWVILTGLAVGLVFEVAIASLIDVLLGTWQGGDVPYFTTEALIACVSACLIPTLVCWRLSLWLTPISKSHVAIEPGRD